MTANLRSLENKLDRLGSTRIKYYLFLGTVFALMTFTVGILTFAAIDLMTSTANSLRTFFFTVIVVLSVVLLVLLGIVPITKRLRRFLLAEDVESEFPELENCLTTSIEYGNDPTKQNRFSTKEMVEALLRQTETRTRPLDFLRCINWRKLRNSGTLFAIIAAVFIIFLLIPNGSTAAKRALIPWNKDITFTRIEDVSGNMAQEEFSDVYISLRLGGRIPEKSTIHIEDQRSEWRNEEMASTKGSSRDFRFRLKNVTRDFSYYINAGDARTEHFRVIVFAVPKMESMKLKLEFPKYTELPSQEIDTGAVVALRGTKITFEGKTNTRVDKASLTFESGKKVKLAIDGTSVSGSFVLDEDDSYRIRLEDNAGRTNKLAISYPVTALRDRRPDIRIIQPNHDLQLIGTAEVPVIIDAADDYGIGEIGLVVNVMARLEEGASAEQRMVKTVLLKIDRSKGDKRTTFENVEGLIYLEDHMLESHDLVSFYAYAIDNDTIGGPKRSVSKIYFIEILPYEEIYREQAGSGMKMMPKLDILRKLIRIQREIIVRNFAVQNDITDPLDEGVRDQILDLSSLQISNAEEASDYAITLEQELLDAGMVESLDKVQTIVIASEQMFVATEILDNLNPEEAGKVEQKALASLYKALTDMEKMVSKKGKEGKKKEKIRQALELADKKTQEKTKKKLEKEQEELAEKKNELEKLKEEQEKLNKEMKESGQEQGDSSSSTSAGETDSEGKGEGKGEGSKKGRSPAEMSQEQNELSARTRKTASELQDLSKKHPNLSGKAGRTTEKAADKMDESRKALDKSDLKKAHGEGKKAEDSLKKALDEITKTEDKNLLEALDRLARDTANTAREQGNLKESATEDIRDEKSLGQHAEQQEELKKLTDRLAGEARELQPLVNAMSKAAGKSVKKASEMLDSGSIQNDMGKAAKSLKEGKPFEAALSQQTAQQELANAAKHLLEAAGDLSRSEKEKLLDTIKKTKETIEKQKEVKKDIDVAEQIEQGSSDKNKASLTGIKNKQGNARSDTQELIDMVRDLQEGGEFSPSALNFNQAVEEMKSTEEGLEQGSIQRAGAFAEEAERNLRKGLSDLKKLYDKQLLADLGDVIRKARRIKKEQDKLIKTTVDSNAGEDNNRRLALKQKWIKDDIEDLGDDLGVLVESSDTISSDAHQRIRNAEKIVASDEIKNAVEDSRAKLEEGQFAKAREKEKIVSAKMADSAEELERAYKMLSTSDISRLWETAEDLNKALEKSESIQDKDERDNDPSTDKKKELAEDLEKLQEDLEDVKASEQARGKIRKASQKMKTLLKPKTDVTGPGPDEKDEIKFVQAQIMAAKDDVINQLNVLIRARRIIFPKDETCPAEYEELVQYYYKALSEF